MRDSHTADPAIVATVDAHIRRATRLPDDGSGRPLALEPADKAYLLRVARAKLEALFARAPLEAADFPDAPVALIAPGCERAQVFVSFYVNGALRGCMGTRKENLIASTLRATELTARDKRFDGQLTRPELEQVLIDIVVVLDGVALESGDPRKERLNVDLGVHGLTFALGDAKAFFKPDVPVKNALSLGQTVARLVRKAGLKTAAWEDPQARILVHPSVQFRETAPARYEDAGTVEIFRGRPVVYQGDVTRYALERTQRLCAEYLTRHVDAKGNLTYFYWPDRNERAFGGGNAGLVRRLASTWVLTELSTALRYRRGQEAAQRSLATLLKLYYTEEADKGIAYLKRKDEVNVGNAGFALLAICATRDPDFRPEQRDKLAAFLIGQIDAKQGFMYPAYLPDPLDKFESKQLYYPGEALLALMAWVELTGNRAPLDLMEAVLPYYANLFETHENSINMAAWMSKAYGAAFALTGNEAFARFVLRMNDKVLTYQIQPGQKAPDLIGAFSGVGNTSAAGVFLESLAEGYRVAEVVGDRERAAAFRRALVIGMRYLVQAQYGPHDLLPAEIKAEALGGYPLSLFEAQVRVDNVQHCGLALLKTLTYLKPPHGVFV